MSVLRHDECGHEFGDQWAIPFDNPFQTKVWRDFNP
jgi:hypothetical protein